MSLIIWFFLLLNFLASASPCEELLTARDPLLRAKAQALQILTDGTPDRLVFAKGIIDSPDPSLIHEVTYPNGTRKYRISFTGMRYIEADSPQAFYENKKFKIKHSRGFFPDGTEIPPSSIAAPWDVVVYTNAFGEKIAHGGLMDQPAAGLLPDMRMNHTRSRRWGKVEYVEKRPGQYEELIFWKEPIHDFNRASKESHWVGHGYGGMLLTKYNPLTGLHELVRRPNGNYLMFYERVIEEKRTSDGRVIPWITTQFVREINPELKNAVGPEYVASDIISPHTYDYFKASARGENGFLIEGGNAFIDIKSEQIIKAFSANEFTGRYGIYLDYLPKGADPCATAIPVTDEFGELIDFADRLGLRELTEGEQLGRPQLEYSPDGKLWLRFHFAKKGSPRRFTAQIPIKIIWQENGHPHLQWDLN